MINHGVTTLKKKDAAVQVSNLKGAFNVNLYEFSHSRKPSVRPFLLSLPMSFTIFKKRPSPSSCYFATNFNASIIFPQRS